MGKEENIFLFVPNIIGKFQVNIKLYIIMLMSANILFKHRFNFYVILVLTKINQFLLIYFN